MTFACIEVEATRPTKIISSLLLDFTYLACKMINELGPHLLIDLIIEANVIRKQQKTFHCIASLGSIKPLWRPLSPPPSHFIPLI